MRLVSWAMSYEDNKDKFKQLVDTSTLNEKPVELIGKSLKFTNLKQKLYVLLDELRLNDPNELIICVDGFDVLVNKNLSEIEKDFDSLNTKILISAEKSYTYQYSQYRDKFDLITSPYRYINSGTYMGRCKDIVDMLNIVINYETVDETTIDQGLVGIWVYNNIDNNTSVKLDTECKIFWVTSEDWDILFQSSKSGGKIKNPNTNSYPYFIHNVCNVSGIGKKAHDSAYLNIMNEGI